MKSNIPIVPLERTDLLKLIPLMTLTKLAKLALKSGTPVTEFIEAALEGGYTSAGGYNALREAGHRTRAVRSDKGQTLKIKLNRLIEQANALQAKLAQQSDSGTGQ
jgi:xanthine dehydrogenase iron-sulfur cluster and FAD-binding subunit A